MKKQEVGIMGEDIAEDYLRKSGYKILERNFKSKYGEIDIVASKDNFLIFVEIRSKSNDDFGIPEETINKEKKWRLRQNTISYVNRKKYKGNYRVDIICITFDENKSGEIKKMNHYENVFL